MPFPKRSAVEEEATLDDLAAAPKDDPSADDPQMLSALSDVDERIRGLRAGGDDYLTKPFAFGELIARLDALARRAHPQRCRQRRPRMPRAIAIMLALGPQ